VDQQPELPSLLQIAVTDFRTQQFFNVAWVSALLGALLLLFSSYVLFGAVLLLGAAIFGALTYWRVRFFRAILDHADETSGQIVTLNRSMFARRGRYTYRMRFAYTYQGRDYHGTSSVMLIAARPTPETGMTVAILVNREQPHHALIPALYREQVHPIEYR
jgi:hypothetical protein